MQGVVLGPGHLQAFSGRLRFGGQECLCALGLPSRPCRELASLTLFMQHTRVTAQRPQGGATRPSPGPVTQGRMHSKGVGEGRPPGPKDPLAQGCAAASSIWLSGGLGTRPEGRAGPPLTCAHFGSSRSSPAATARGLGSACEAPGHCRGRPLRRVAEGPSWAAPARSDEGSNRTAVSLRPSSPAPPRRPRPPQPRRLPELVVPSLASAVSSPEIRMLGTAWVEAGVGGWGAGLVVVGEVGKVEDAGFRHTDGRKRTGWETVM